jgi:signal transduction histidine kinase
VRAGTDTRLAAIVRRPLVQFSAVILLGLIVVGGGAVWASERAGHSEALNEARSLTEQSARSIIMPNLTSALLRGDEDAVNQLDADVDEHLLGDRVVRVKLWSADGTIVYSDVSELVGEMYELDPQRLEAQESAVAVADVGHHEGSENRFEIALGPLLEVYLPIEGPDGESMLFEVYFDGQAVARSSSRIASTVVPIILISLGSVGLLTLTMAYRMSRRMTADRLERERLLARAADASTDERRRIAADLHDGVIQELSGTALLLNSARTSAEHDEMLSAKLDATSSALRQSLTSLRSLAIEIHPPNIASANLELTLEDQLTKARARHGLQTTMKFNPSSVIRDEHHKRLIYRFVMEGLRNVVKHSDADSVELTVDGSSSDRVVVSLADDGSGFDELEPRTGLGIPLLNDLSAEVGGSVSICGRNDLGGTTLHLEIPA